MVAIRNSVAWFGVKRTVCQVSLPTVMRDVIVLQTLTLGMERHKSLIAKVLSEQNGVRHILERNDGPTRSAEGLPPVVGLLYGGDPGEREIDVDGLRFLVNFLHGSEDRLVPRSAGKLFAGRAICSWPAGARLFLQSGRICAGVRESRSARGDGGGERRSKAQENFAKTGPKRFAHFRRLRKMSFLFLRPPNVEAIITI